MPGRSAEMEFQVVTTVSGDGVATASVSGEADLYTAPELKDALNALTGEAAARLVLVDLSRTTFIDSTTLGVLMGTLKKLRAQGGEIAIACDDPNIRRIFEITLLNRVFAIFDSVEAGLSHLRRADRAKPG